MKILQINSVLNTGSTGRIAENIGKAILDTGWNSFVGYGRRKHGESYSLLIKTGTRLDVYFHVLKTRLFDGHGFASKRATKKLIAKIEKINPDIIHLHNIHGYYLNIEILFKYLSFSKKPVVWTLHDCWAFTGHCAYFDHYECEKWKSLCFDCPAQTDYPKSLFLDNSRKNFQNKQRLFNSVSNLTLVPVSNWLKSLLSDSFLNDKKSVVIHNGINITIFSPSKKNSSIEKRTSLKIILGVASIWDRRKGLEDFIKLNSIIDDSFQIVLVGLSKKQLKKLPSSIIGIERTNNITELVELYRESAVFVNPTYEDNFPTTNLEALACGTPIITYRTGGSPESIDDNTGFVVEKGDINSLYEKIKFICGKGKDFYQYNCRKRAEQFYNMNDRYQDYIELYKKILNK